MLVLTRKRGERVLIGSTMSVVVLEVQGNRVKLGFDCPRDVPVLREELDSAIPARALACVPCGDESEYYAEFA